MNPVSHPWKLSPREAVALQQQLAPQVIRHTTLGPVTRVAGIDASYRNGQARAAIVSLSYPDLTLLEFATAKRLVDFPYVPGLLSFREGPAVLDALDALHIQPDLLIFDGHGLAHPRHFGLASHIGLLTDLPSIGCAKSRLWGKYEEPEIEKGAFSYLKDHDEIIGAVVRTRSRVKPVFVSIGHRIDLRTSITFVLNCTIKYRLPETTRWAHRVAGGAKPHT